MDRSRISRLAHAEHPIGAPIAPDRMAALVQRIEPRPGARVLDVGCGEGVWVGELLRRFPTATADGVDPDAAAGVAAVARAERFSAGDRFTFHGVAVAEFPVPAPYDVVLCVGSTHAFGDPATAPSAIADLLAPGGAALIGEGFWEQPPDPALEAEIGTYADLPGTVAEAEAAGFTLVYAHTSTLDEWDDYEWSWTGSLAGWALAHPGPDGDAALAASRRHREMWWRYRGRLGFVTMLLRRS
jgi:SAM-dependent methyltransferase